MNFIPYLYIFNSFPTLVCSVTRKSESVIVLTKISFWDFRGSIRYCRCRSLKLLKFCEPVLTVITLKIKISDDFGKQNKQINSSIKLCIFQSALRLFIFLTLRDKTINAQFITSKTNYKRSCYFVQKILM